MLSGRVDEMDKAFAELVEAKRSGQGDEILEKLQEKFTTAATKLAEHLEQVKRSNSSTEDYAVLAEKLKGKQQVIEKASHLVGKWDQRLQELINTAEKEIS